MAAQRAPMTVEVTRGAMVESRHAVSVMVSDTEGRLILALGDPERMTYPRSAAKPLQSLALIETGAADAFELGDAEIAVSAASHNGEPRHVEVVGRWLTKLGLGEGDLACGPQWPDQEADVAALHRAGQRPSRLHNNCSGKHAGFLSVARHLGVDPKGYEREAHPVQQRLLGILEVMTGLDLSATPRGVDGCGIPVIGVPLGNLALAMARLAAPSDQPEARQAACRRVLEAVAAEPFMIAGTGRFCTEVIAALNGQVLVKTGAEGVYVAALPSLGLGAALKVEDGGTRAAEVAMGAVLTALNAIPAVAESKLAGLLVQPLHNRAGLQVGEVRPAEAIEI